MDEWMDGWALMQSPRVTTTKTPQDYKPRIMISAAPEPNTGSEDEGRPSSCSASTDGADGADLGPSPSALLPPAPASMLPAAAAGPGGARKRVG